MRSFPPPSPFRHTRFFSLYLLHRLLSTYYTRRRTHEQQHLLKLLKRQHELLEEVKRKSGWYKTKDLLDRYEEGGSVSILYLADHCCVPVTEAWMSS